MPPEPRRKGRTKSDDTFEVRSDPRVNKSNGTVSGSEQSEYSFAVANSEKYSKQKINMDDGKIASMRVVDFNKLQDPAYKAGKARRKLILEVVIRACDEALDKKNDPEFVFDDNNSDEDNAIAISALTIMGFDPKFSNNKDVEAIANLLEISQDKLGQEMEAIRSDISTYSSSSCRPNGDKMYEEFSDAVGPLIASETTSIREMRNATLLTTHSIFKHNPASPRDRTRSLPVVDPISSLKL